jgi:hypothetical protein
VKFEAEKIWRLTSLDTDYGQAAPQLNNGTPFHLSLNIASEGCIRFDLQRLGPDDQRDGSFQVHHANAAIIKYLLVSSPNLYKEYNLHPQPAPPAVEPVSFSVKLSPPRACV